MSCNFGTKAGKVEIIHIFTDQEIGHYLTYYA